MTDDPVVPAWWAVNQAFHGPPGEAILAAVRGLAAFCTPREQALVEALLAASAVREPNGVRYQPVAAVDVLLDATRTLYLLATAPTGPPYHYPPNAVTMLQIDEFWYLMNRLVHAGLATVVDFNLNHRGRVDTYAATDLAQALVAYWEAHGT